MAQGTLKASLVSCACRLRFKSFARIHLDAPDGPCFQMGGVAGFGLEAEEDGAATGTRLVQAASVDQVGIKHEDITGAA